MYSYENLLTGCVNDKHCCIWLLSGYDVVQFGCDEYLYCYVYKRWQIRGLNSQQNKKNNIEEGLTTFLKLVMS